MDQLKEHPQIVELLDTLDKNGLMKEKNEVQSLVSYIGGMEETLTEMLGELQDMRREINLIHNNTLRSKCHTLVEKTEGKIRQGFSAVKKMKDNLIQSAGNAVRAFRERGRDALAESVRAMKIPEALDKLSAMFGRMSKEMAQDTKKLSAMQAEFQGAKGHLKNMGLLFMGKAAKEAEHSKTDKGVLSRLSRLFEKAQKIELCGDSLKTVLVLLLLYGMGIGIYLSTRRNYRRREEHGSAKWGSAKAIDKKYRQSPPSENKLMTQNVRIGLNAKKHRRNLNTLVCGGSGAGKTRFYCKPNLMQTSNSSQVILDPKGEILRDVGNLLEKAGYEIKVLDLISMEKSHCYNPFVYLRDDNDIQRLVTNLFKSTTPKGSQSNDPFWDTAASMLLLALVFYLHYEAPEEEQNFAMVMEMLRAAAIEDEEDNRPSPLDNLFADLEMDNPEHIALKYYRSYHSGSAKTLKSIQITLAARLEKFNLESLAALTSTDELDLASMGEKKTALFALIPDNDSSFNFLVSILYTQLFQQLFYSADHIHGGSLPIPVHFLMDEFANVSLPDDFDKILSVMRSRGVSVSIILQNLAQLKALFEKQWESIVGNCDEFLYLGGNEQSTHKYVSELLGKETIDTNTYGKSEGRSGSYSTNYQISGRELLTPDEVRMLDNRYAILFIRGELPVMDLKYDILKHPNVAYTADGRGGVYRHGEVTKNVATIETLWIDLDSVPETELSETTYELLSDEDFENLTN